MEYEDMRFFPLCLAELMVVLTGLASIPAALILQVLVPLIIFYDRIVSFRFIPFIVVFVLASTGFTALLVVLGHVFIPLILLAVIVSLTVLLIILAEARLLRIYGGVT